MDRHRSEELETLARLFARVLFIDHVNATTATNDDTVFFQCFNGGTHFHRKFLVIVCNLKSA